MQIVVRRGALATAAADVIVLTRFLDDQTLDATARAVDALSGGLVAALVRSKDFSGKPNEIAILHPASGKPRRVLMLGLGNRAALTPHRLLQAMAVASRRARDLGAAKFACTLPGTSPVSAARAAQALAEGAVLGLHRFENPVSATPATLKQMEILVADAAAARELAPHAARGAQWARSACTARDLANAPGNELIPERLADAAREIGSASGARVQVLGVREMEKLGMGAVLAVGKGSVNPPRFIVLDRPALAGKAGRNAKAPKRPAPTIVLIGKGVTFDTGGISIKPREGMARMKYDMAGAAAVLGVFAALPSLELPFRVVGLIPSAENMPGGRAFKPGDVVRAMDGTAIEITNTDAEGRLVLADALVYARRFEPVAVVDLATLTGAISLALGHLAAGLFTRDDGLAAELDEAARASGDRLWRMPLWEEYGDSLRSDVADFTNSGAREGGASIAAVFLSRFAKDLPWVHLDIASTAWSYAEKPHEGRGPNGFGVRLLLEWLRARAAQRATGS